MAEAKERSKGGRTLDPATDRAILEAAKEILGEVGFSRLSMQAITDRTGIAKTTIYRRYPDKTALAGAAIREIAGEWTVDTGDTRSDLRTLLERQRAVVDMGLVGSLLAEEAHNPELLERFRELVIHNRVATVELILARGIERGEVRSDLDVTQAAELLFGAFLAHYMRSGRPGDDWSDAVLDAVWPAISS